MLNWLDTTEGKLNGLRNVPAETDAIEQQITQLKVSLEKRLLSSLDSNENIMKFVLRYNTVPILKASVTVDENVNQFYQLAQSLNEEVLPKHLEIQELNSTTIDVVKDCSADQAGIIKEPVNDINRRWEELHDSIAKRTVRMTCLVCLVCLVCFHIVHLFYSNKRLQSWVCHNYFEQWMVFLCLVFTATFFKINC